MKGSENFLPRDLEFVSSPPTYSGVSALVAGSDILGDILSALVVGSLTFRPLVWRRFLKALDTKVFPYYWGFPKFSEGLLHDCKQSPGRFDSCLLLF